MARLKLVKETLGVFQPFPSPGAVLADPDFDLAVGMAIFVLIVIGDDDGFYGFSHLTAFAF